MKTTEEMVRKSEEMYDTYCSYEEVLYSIRSAIETLSDLKNRNATGYAESLGSIVDQIEHEKEELEVSLAKIESIEKDQQLADYWRAVV